MATEPSYVVPAVRMVSLHLATRNAAAFWTALAQTRGHGPLTRPGFVGVDGGERGGLRVLHSCTRSWDTCGVPSP